MTLILAGIEGNSLWIMSDTIISDPYADVRQRRYEMKIVRAARGLVAFAGTVETARTAIASLSESESIETTLDKLSSCCRKNNNIEFCFGIVDGQGPKLFKITDCSKDKLPSLWLGDMNEFNRFRYIKSQPLLPARKRTYHSLTITSPSHQLPPTKAFLENISPMLSLFSGCDEKGVGGWVVPYWADSKDRYIGSYEYRVSDLLLEELPPGHLIPAPTLEGGGLILNFMPMPDGHSAVARWRPSDIAIAFIEKNGKFETVRSIADPANFLKLLMKDLDPETIQRIQIDWANRELGKKPIKDSSGKILGYAVINESGFDIETVESDGLPFTGWATEQ